MDDERREDLEKEVRKIEASVEKLSAVTNDLNRSLGRIILAGLINSLLAVPILGLTVYVAVRLALRNTRYRR